MTEINASSPVKDFEEYRKLVKGNLTRSDVVLSFDQQVQLDILRQLIALNNKLTSFMVVAAIGVVIVLMINFMAGF